MKQLKNEKDIIVLGDFNMSPDCEGKPTDISFCDLRMNRPSSIQGFIAILMTYWHYFLSSESQYKLKLKGECVAVFNKSEHVDL